MDVDEGDMTVKRVLLVDDHAIFTQAMKLVLGKMDGMEVAGTAGTLAQGRELVSLMRPGAWISWWWI